MREHDRQPAETALIAQRNQQVTATLLINDAAFQPVRPLLLDIIDLEIVN